MLFLGAGDDAVTGENTVFDFGLAADFKFGVGSARQHKGHRHSLNEFVRSYHGFILSKIIYSVYSLF